MALYGLKRISDQKQFRAQRDSSDAALFYFSILTGEELTLDGVGQPPYLFGSGATPAGRVDTTIPVYRKNA